jgi:hypothetical protein
VLHIVSSLTNCIEENWAFFGNVNWSLLLTTTFGDKIRRCPDDKLALPLLPHKLENETRVFG